MLLFFFVSFQVSSTLIVNRWGCFFFGLEEKELIEVLDEDGQREEFQLNGKNEFNDELRHHTEVEQKSDVKGDNTKILRERFA